MRVIIAIVLCFVAVALAGKCQYSRPPRDTSYEVPSANTKCPQYSKDTCCVPEYLNGREAIVDDGCSSSPNQCTFLLGLINCGYECKPDFLDSYLDTNEQNKIRLCTQFYQSIITACGDMTTCPTPNANTTFDCRTPDGKKLCGRLFNTPDQFFDQYRIPGTNLQFIKATDNNNCFNAAGSIVPAFGMMLALLALFF
eukprot:TRINITY_DN9535_c0_g1_i1.p1 TRINITY_DN9535_c0_g1~~TRINITY_DN9535_c0_g1_i1.p1  ORF type:complete len:213 (+),score=48.39 TRINITY_DN9535_c0_g1_i1:50-640(+)